MTAADLLRREGTSLVDRLRVWTPTRWAAAASPGRSRADVVHHLAQRLADEAADLEGRERRPLPRLDADPAVTDQLAVTLDDVLRAGPPDERARRLTAHVLLHRTELLGEAVPAGLAEALECGDVLATGGDDCRVGGAPPGGGVDAGDDDGRSPAGTGRRPRRD